MGTYSLATSVEGGFPRNYSEWLLLQKKGSEKEGRRDYKEQEYDKEPLFGENRRESPNFPLEGTENIVE